MEAVINENNIELVVKLNLVASNIDAQLNTAKDALSKTLI